MCDADVPMRLAGAQRVRLRSAARQFAIELQNGFRMNKRNAAVRVPSRSLMVQREQWDTYWGPKNEMF